LGISLYLVKRFRTQERIKGKRKRYRVKKKQQYKKSLEISQNTTMIIITRHTN